MPNHSEKAKLPSGGLTGEGGSLGSGGEGGSSKRDGDARVNITMEGNLRSKIELSQSVPIHDGDVSWSPIHIHFHGSLAPPPPSPHPWVAQWHVSPSGHGIIPCPY